MGGGRGETKGGQKRDVGQTFREKPRKGEDRRGEERRGREGEVRDAHTWNETVEDTSGSYYWKQRSEARSRRMERKKQLYLKLYHIIFLSPNLFRSSIQHKLRALTWQLGRKEKQLEPFKLYYISGPAPFLEPV